MIPPPAGDSAVTENNNFFGTAGFGWQRSFFRDAKPRLRHARSLQQGVG